MFGKKLILTAFLLGCLAALLLPVYVHAQDAAPTAGTTLENLMTAFNGESNANARYLAFAQKADEEGYAKAASLFRAAARAEQVHFERHAAIIKALGGEAKATIEAPVVKSTKENLQAAMEGEIYESTKMYPAFLAKAKEEKIADAVDVFENAQEAEGVHAGLYKQALNDLENWKTKTDFMVCPKCGNVVQVIMGTNCPICSTDTNKFMTIN